MFLVFALISSLFFGLEQVFRAKYARSMDHFAVVTVRNASFLLTMLPLLFFVPASDFPKALEFWPWVLGAAFFGYIAVLFYMAAYKYLPVGVVSVVSRVRVVFVALWAYLFLGETLSAGQILLSALILLTIAFLGMQKFDFPHLNAKSERGYIYMFMNAFFVSLSLYFFSLMSRAVHPFYAAYLWEASIGVVALLVFGGLRVVRPSLTQLPRWFDVGKMALISSFVVVASSAYAFAVNYGEIALVNVVAVTSVAFTTLFAHYFYAEKLTRRQLLLILVVILEVAGLQLI